MRVIVFNIFSPRNFTPHISTIVCRCHKDIFAIAEAINNITGVVTMLETIAVLLILLWLAGLVSSYTLGGFIHILLVIAIVVILLRLIQGRRLA